MQPPDLDANEQQHTSKAFLQFTLTGHGDFNNIPGHLTLNACQDLHDPAQYQITCDYNSLIGATKDLPYKFHLALSPVPPYREVLHKPNHMKALAYIQVSLVWLTYFLMSDFSDYSLPNQLLCQLHQGQPTQVPMHTIPNFAFGKVATRSVV